MIDFEVTIFDELARLIIAEYPTAYVSSEHVLAPPSFPAVFMEQTYSSEVDSGRDSSGEENLNAIIWTINVYSNSESNARDECKRILAIVDEHLRSLNMKRVTARAIDNATDPSIYRYMGRFTGIVDKYGNLYWR